MLNSAWGSINLALLSISAAITDPQLREVKQHLCCFGGHLTNMKLA